MSRELYQVHPTKQEIHKSWQEIDTAPRDNIIQDLDMPWYTKPAVILGKLYPEISIKKIYSEETLPPYLPKGKFLNSSFLTELHKFPTNSYVAKQQVLLHWKSIWKWFKQLAQVLIFCIFK